MAIKVYLTTNTKCYVCDIELATYQVKNLSWQVTASSAIENHLTSYSLFNKFGTVGLLFMHDSLYYMYRLVYISFQGLAFTFHFILYVQGLKVGERILKVNDDVFQDITHAQAVVSLKSSQKLTLFVAPIGQMPGGTPDSTPRYSSIKARGFIYTSSILSEGHRINS